MFAETPGMIEPREGAFNHPSDGALFSPKYQHQDQAVPSNQKRKSLDILRPHRTSEQMDTAYTLV